MEKLPKTVVTQMARKAGIKTVSDDTESIIIDIVNDTLTDVLRHSIIASEEVDSKILSKKNIIDGMSLMDINITAYDK